MSWKYSSVELLEEMKKDFPTLVEQCDYNTCPLDCWCNHLDPNQFPFLVKLVSNNDYGQIKSCLTNESTVRDSLKESRQNSQSPTKHRKRARMPDHVRRQKKKEAVDRHRKNILIKIETSKEALNELGKIQQQLDKQNQVLKEAQEQLTRLLNIANTRICTFQ